MGQLDPRRGRGRYPRIPDETRTKIIAALKAGERAADIARRYKVDASVVSNIKRKAGLPMDNRGRYPRRRND